jgi:hypothetical protein
VSSGLLLIVFIEEFVFRRSDVVVGSVSTFLLVLFRESHENGLVSLRATGGAGRDFSWIAGGGGGGRNLTGDIFPDKPCMEAVESRESLGGSFGSMLEAFAPSGPR